MKKKLSIITLLIAVVAYIWKKNTGGQCEIRNEVSLTDKTVILTGGNAGIGRAAAYEIAARGARLIIASRNVVKSQQVQQDIINKTGNTDVVAMKLDLGDMDSVAEFARNVLATETHIDYLINNAGVLFMKGTTPQGYGKVFAINHLGPFLLTNLLMDRMKNTSESRPVKIINVSSEGYKLGPIDLENCYKEQNSTSFIDNFLLYSSTKLANIHFTRSLAQRAGGNRNLTSFSLHPGAIDSDIGLTVFEFYGGKKNISVPVGWSLWLFRQIMIPLLQTNEYGGRTIIACMLDNDHGQFSGGYFNECSYQELPDYIRNDNDGVAERLWELSARLVKPWLS